MSRNEFSTKEAKKLFVALICIGLVVDFQSQPIENADIIFQPPVKIPIHLSGNFGEFRSNHFHTGIDIRTEGRIGIPIYASEDGYVSRISISPGGYGKALYLDHPNGYTTVYGHLSKFKDTIDVFSKQWQYENESFEMNYYPEPGDFPVTKNELIALSGNTGHSGGPHLHFEIRDTQSEHVLNPLNFGINVPDDQAPYIKQIRIYSLKETGERPNGKSYEAIGGSGKYRLSSTPKASGKFGIGIDAYDIFNGRSGHCGIYELKLFVNEELIYEMQMDELDFETVRYINTHMDYELYKNQKRKITRCYLSENNRLLIYPSVLNMGIINPQKAQSLECKVELKDNAGNLSTLNFDISCQPEEFEIQYIDTAHFMDASSDNVFRTEDCIVYIPKGRLYDDMNFQLDSSEAIDQALSKIYQVGDILTPLQDEISIKIRLKDFLGDTSKLGLVLINEKDQKIFKAGKYKNGWVTGDTKNFGRYAISIDTIPPQIKTKGNYEGQKLNGAINFNLSDNLSGIESYRCEVDGRWLLLASNSSRSYVYGNLKDLDLDNGEHELKITATDYTGNQNSRIYNFIW